MRKLKAGLELVSLEVVPPPTVPMPTHLSMFLMRPPGGFYPVMSSMPPGRFPTGVMDPAMVVRPPRLPGMGGPPGGMVGVPGDVKQAAPSANLPLPFMSRPNNMVRNRMVSSQGCQSQHHDYTHPTVCV